MLYPGRFAGGFITLRELFLHVDRERERFDYAGKRKHEAVAHAVEAFAPVCRAGRLHAFEVCVDSNERSGLVGMNQGRISDHVGEDDGSKAPLPRRSGVIDNRGWLFHDRRGGLS